MRTLFDFLYGNFKTLFDRVVLNLRELPTTYQVALALAVVALIFVAVMILIYILRVAKYRTVKEIQNVDVVFFNSVWELEAFKKGKQGETLFIFLIPFTFVINFVVKVFMFRSFEAINSSDYITRRMLENMQLENMRLKDKNKDLLKMIDEAGLNKRKRPVKPAPRPKKEEPVKAAPVKEEEKKPAPKKEEAKVEVKEEKTPPKKEVKKEAVEKKEEVKKEEPPKQEKPKEASQKKEEPIVEEVKEEAVTSSTLVTEDDKEPEVILATNNIEDPIIPPGEILEAEIIEPDQDKLDELIDLVSSKETRGKA